MNKKILITVIALSLLATPSLADFKKANIHDDVQVTWNEGQKGKDGYVEIITRSKDVYRIHPCGKVEKLIWKEISSNSENTTLYQSEGVLYWDGTKSAWTR
jgi:hypothetical protein